MQIFDYIILGHANPDVDSVVSGVLLERYLSRQGYRAKFVIPDTVDDETLGLCLKYGLNPCEYQGELPLWEEQKYILVDHFERELPGNVVAVIDHHPTSRALAYSYYRNELASSTASMIVKGREDEFSREEICLAVLATLVDTVSFHSSKTQAKDIYWVQEMVSRYQLPALELRKDGLSLTEIHDVRDFLEHGLKNYQFDDKKVAASYVSLLHPEEYQELYPEVFSSLQGYIADNQLELFALLVHDMSAFQSSVYYVSPMAIEKKEFSHVVSRGNEVIPELEKKMYLKK